MSSGLCPFKDIFGAPGTGVHSIRLFDIAVVDTVLTILGAVYLAKYKGWNVYWTVFWVFVVGEVMHVLFCVDTTVVKVFKKIFIHNKVI